MEAPVNIVVESLDAERAELVGRAIGQSLRDDWWFKDVTVAHIVKEEPNFRAWQLADSDESQQSLLDAMKESNPTIFNAAVTVISRQSNDTTTILSEDLVKLGGIGEVGVTAEEAAAGMDVAYVKAPSDLTPTQVAEMFSVKCGIAVEKIVKL